MLISLANYSLNTQIEYTMINSCTAIDLTGLISYSVFTCFGRTYMGYTMYQRVFITIRREVADKSFSKKKKNCFENAALSVLCRFTIIRFGYHVDHQESATPHQVTQAI